MAGPTRTMGTRAVTVTVTFPIKGARNVTEKGWRQIDKAIDRFVADASEQTILEHEGAVVELAYARNVEMRPERVVRRPKRKVPSKLDAG